MYFIGDGVSLEIVNSIVNSPSVYLTLFIGLLSYTLRSSNAREMRLQEQLDKIIPILDNLVRDVNDIKNDMKKGSDK